MRKIANTPVGTFKRVTENSYEYIVVRTSPRAKESFDLFQQHGKWSSLVTEQRWIRDNGYAVTWHKSLESAKKSALGSYSWDKSATLVGVYEVQQ
jgi:hypothetical protein